MIYDAIIIGGGAAGLFCAIEAGKRGRRVLVIERNAQVGRKIIISGGGRCNFTNVNTTPENFISQNPHFCKSALARYTPGDFVELVKKHKISFYEKKLGQLFCRESSRQIVEMLLKECKAARVVIKTGCSVSAIRRQNVFEVETDEGIISCHSLVIATGGLSFPKIGATDFGFRIARQFGLKIVEMRPSLVPMIFEGRMYPELAGVSIDVEVSTDEANFRENLLFTHRGLSGPATLQISNYWQKDKTINVNLLPTIKIRNLLIENRGSRKQLDNFLAEHLPARFAETFAADKPWAKPLYQLNDSEIDAIAGELAGWKVKFNGTEGYDKAEVTLGGVSTSELSSKTMESKKNAGLYFIGEAVDVTGWLGGYNFQWAWASGFAAGQEI